MHQEETLYLDDLKKINDDTKHCQCCIPFTKKEVNEMETKDICDIHDFNYDLLKNLRWTCPRTGRSNKGAFYTKQKPSKNNPLFELKSYLDVIAIWKPKTNWEFKWQQYSGDIWYKDFLTD